MRIRVHGYRQFGALARRLRAAAAAAGGLRDDVADALQAAARPVQAEVRSTVLSAQFPARPRALVQRRPIPKPPLREGLANATRTYPLPWGVRFRVFGPAVGRGKWGVRLAELSDGERAGRWRHPVFADREHWVQQDNQSWFFAPIRAAEPQFRAAVQRGMNKTARRITRDR